MYHTVISHRDVDGIVCALLLKKVFPEIKKVIWSQPYYIGTLKVDSQTIICDLPLRRGCGLWFDHHKQAVYDYNGIYDITAKSCARIIYEHYKDKLGGYEELVKETDKIDSGDITLADMKKPTPLEQLSMCIAMGRNDDFADWILAALESYTPEQIIRTEYIEKRLAEKNMMIADVMKRIKPKFISCNRNKMLIIEEEMKVPKSAFYRLFSKNLKCIAAINITKTKIGYRFMISRNIFNKKLKDMTEIRNEVKKRCGIGYGNGSIEVRAEDKEKTLKEIIEVLGGKKDDKRGRGDTGRDNCKTV